VSYGISGTTHGLLDWAGVIERLSVSRNYWIATTRPDGRPHVSPVWGVVVDANVVVGMDPDTVKGRNIRAGSSVALHLESGDDVVILEGTAELVDDDATMGWVRTAFVSKYSIDVVGDEETSAAFYLIRPDVGFAWLEADFPNTATRFDLGRDG
jgi:PPOX class probable F420-dependent enzyme